jgi:hypothetical protein
MHKEKPTESKGQMDNLIIIVEDFNILFSKVDKTTRPKINNEKANINNI